MIPFRKRQRMLEKHFTVVIWEQRGTGKSFDPGIAPESMTIDRMVEDGRELAELLLEEFGKRKLLLVGHSWGSVLGVILAKRYPSLFYAYVGSGQAVRPALAEKIGYRYVLDRARAGGAVTDELRALDEPEPYLTIDEAGTWYEKLLAQRRYLVRYGGENLGGRDNSLLFDIWTIFEPEYTLADFARFARGSSFSLKALWPEFMRLDFLNDARELEVPVPIAQGRHDFNQPASLVAEWFEALHAPIKKLRWFEKSAHHPMYEEAEAYAEFLVKEALPLCTQE